MKYLIEDTTLQNIANSIKDKRKSTEPIKVEDFSNEISNISSGGTSGINTDLTGYNTVNRITVSQFITEIPDIDISESTIKITNLSYTFSNCYKLTKIGNIENTSNVNNMIGMFQGCTNLTEVPNFDTSKVNNTAYMFANCTNLTEVPNFDTSKVNDIAYMFANCTNLTEVPNFDTSNVNNTAYMFYGCTDLKSVPNFDTSNVKDFSLMFVNCHSLKSVPNFDFRNTSSTYGISNIFNGCTNLTSAPVLNLYKEIKLITGVFYNCINLVDVPEFNFSNTTGISQMFCHCNNLSDTSIQNIINSILNCTKVTSTTYKSLFVTSRYSPFYNTNITNIRYQNRWDELTAAGWSY